VRNRIHAVLAGHGHGRPAGCWSGPGRAWLAGLALPAVSREVIEDDLAMIDALQQPIDRLGLEVREHARAGPRVTVLTALPGVGPFTALVIPAGAGDVTRFGSARKLAAWAGLTPTVRGSDRTVRHGHMSRQGPAWVRSILCEAAQTAKRSPEFAASYQAIAARRGKKIATTAIARKLLTRACHLLTGAEHAAAQIPRPSAGDTPRQTGRSPSPGQARQIA
jgi:transposase